MNLEVNDVDIANAKLVGRGYLTGRLFAQRRAYRKTVVLMSVLAISSIALSIVALMLPSINLLIAAILGILATGMVAQSAQSIRNVIEWLESLLRLV